VTGTSIALGLKQFIHAFTARCARKYGGRVEMFPFLSLTAPDDSPWKGIRRAMDAADAVYFNMQGMTKERFQSWLGSGRHRYEPAFRELGWTNWELYEVLTVEQLRVKTTFYGDSGEETDEPTDWLDLS
jgi:hypothetical protein